MARCATPCFLHTTASSLLPINSLAVFAAGSELGSYKILQRSSPNSRSPSPPGSPECPFQVCCESYISISLANSFERHRQPGGRITQRLSNSQRQLRDNGS